MLHMRKTLFPLLFLLGMSMTMMGQSLSSINPNPMQPGFTGTVSVTGTGTNFSISTGGLNLRLTHVGSGQIYNFGNAPGGGAWSPGYNGMPSTTAAGNITLPGNAPVGNYNVTIIGFNGDNWIQNLSVTGNAILQVAVPPNVGFFTGKVVLETDSNCVQNVGEEGLPNRLVYGNPGNYLTATDANGNFSLPMPLGTYTISTLAPGTSIVCPASPFTHVATVNTSGGTASGLNFYLKDNHQLDLSTSLSIGIHRPGFSNNFWAVNATNNSYTPALNTVLKLVKPSNITLNSFNIPPTSTNGDTAFWNLGTLAGGTTVGIYGTAYVPINTLGMGFTYHSDVTTSSVDTSPFNNAQTATNTIQGSYDPNDKQVWVSNTGANADGLVLPTDSLFRYLIRFQNTGTDTAFNIIIRDTFDTDLDMSTLTITGSSHSYNLQIPDSTGRRLAFVFPNILLVDSFENEVLSHGWIQYTIRKKNGLANGTVLSNRASIYFDFNLPVLTNTVNTTICPLVGTAFTHTTNVLTAAFQGPTTGSANGWVWDFGDGQTGTGANPSHAYATGGTYMVCVTVTNACGRSAQICAPVTVACAPLVVAFNHSPGAGNTVNFTNASTGGSLSLLWQFGDGTTSTLINPSHSYTQPGLYTVCLIATNVCAEADTTCATFAVGCASAPVSGFGQSVSLNVATFVNTSTGINLSYAWDFGDGGSSTQASPAHTYAAAGTYNVCLTVTDVCAGTSTFCSNVTTTCATPQSLFGATVNMGSVTFADQSIHAPTAWAWDFGDGGTSSLQNPTHTYAGPGTYSVCLTTTNACGSDDLCQDVTVTAVGVSDAQFGFITLSPNPAQDRVQLRMAQAQSGVVNFTLSDALGRVVTQWQADIVGDYARDIDLGNQSEGVYFLRMEAQGQQQVLRVAVQR